MGGEIILEDEDEESSESGKHLILRMMSTSSPTGKNQKGGGKRGGQVEETSRGTHLIEKARHWGGRKGHVGMAEGGNKLTKTVKL